MNMTIKAARVNASLSQKVAAEKLGLGYRTLRGYESGEYELPLKVKLKMASLYNIEVGRLEQEANYEDSSR